MFVNHHNFRVIGNELRVRQASYRTPSELYVLSTKDAYNNTVRVWALLFLFASMESRVSSLKLQIAIEKHSGCPKDARQNRRSQQSGRMQSF